MTEALILIDIQRDYFPGGKMTLADGDLAADHASKVLTHFRERGLPVIHVHHVSLEKNASFFLPDTDGQTVDLRVQPEADEVVITKHTPNAFLDTELASVLQQGGIEAVVVVGMMTHMCIDATVRAAHDRGLDVTLLGDATATRDLSFSGQRVPAYHVSLAFLAALNGTYARVISTRDFLNRT